MPEYIAVRCYSCRIHQAIQVNLKRKFTCKLCNAAQSVKAVLANGTSGRELRPVVQELNLRLQQEDEAALEAKRSSAASLAAASALPAKRLRTQEPAAEAAAGREAAGGAAGSTASAEGASRWTRFVAQAAPQLPLEAAGGPAAGGPASNAGTRGAAAIVAGEPRLEAGSRPASRAHSPAIDSSWGAAADAAPRSRGGSTVSGAAGASSACQGAAGWGAPAAGWGAPAVAAARGWGRCQSEASGCVRGSTLPAADSAAQERGAGSGLQAKAIPTPVRAPSPALAPSAPGQARWGRFLSG